jgi:hypothetical protein
LCWKKGTDDCKGKKRVRRKAQVNAEGTISRLEYAEGTNLLGWKKGTDVRSGN